MNINSKLIAKNTIVLFIRMLFVMFLSIYTSRIVLTALGIDDFGIYNVVGSIVTMFAFFNSSLTLATSRFISCKLGVNDTKGAGKVFSTSLILHVGIALLTLLLSETIGLWFLNNKLLIPETRMFAAKVVFQFSVLTFLASILQIPYNSVIISHENMNVFAFISVIDTILKLLIVYLLYFSDKDKLIVYSFLILCVSVFIMFLYQSYARNNYNESRFVFEKDIELYKTMFSYIGVSFYISFVSTLLTQGIILLQNMYFGVAINAALAIATKIQSSVNVLAENFLTAVRPQIYKLYAQGSFVELETLVYRASRLGFVVMLSVILPLYLTIELVLKLWLVEVPPLSAEFCRIYLLLCPFSVIFNPLHYAIYAAGKIKLFGFLCGTLYFLALPFSYLFLQYFQNPLAAVKITVIMTIISYLASIGVLKYNIPELSIKKFVIEVIIPCFTLLILLYVFSSYLYSLSFISSHFLKIVIAVIDSFALTVLIGCPILLKENERKLIFSYLKRLLPACSR